MPRKAKILAPSVPLAEARARRAELELELRRVAGELAAVIVAELVASVLHGELAKLRDTYRQGAP